MKKLKTKNILYNRPFILGCCTKAYKISPKKPNSAERKVVSLIVLGNRKVLAYIPGIGHNIKEHSTVLLRGGRTKDLPGFKYKVVRGYLDSSSVVNRITSRSKYGKKLKK